jgi:predicted O-methyltransferase YrrM
MAGLTFIKRGQGWLTTHAGDGAAFPPLPDETLIEARAAQTQQTGAHPLWEGYRASGSTRGGPVRTSNQVRTRPAVGRFLSWLVSCKQARCVVEFGTAFGVSGMYFLSGLKSVPDGRLYTFDPNETWAMLAEENLRSVHDGFTLTKGTFEDNADRVLGSTKIDVAFIDAIHTSAFVTAQLEVVLRHAAPGAVILFDDIAFSRDMASCWRALSTREDFVATAAIGSRLGVAELANA